LVSKASTRVPPDAYLEVHESPRFVSRGGDKLVAALEAFSIDVRGLCCADVGASTGGFTDCLLQHGAERVYAIDVGQGLLHWKLRGDPRIVLMERTNARHVAELPEAVDLTTLDVAFISLRVLFPVITDWLAPDGQVIALVKPQFEAGRASVGKGGVVRDPAVHRRVLEEVALAASQAHLAPQGIMSSPLQGPKGNIEFFLWCRQGGAERSISSLLASVFP
jgi:23S rRNA (cytidine1920-2'-O)/16S rRNA (cytidine1409-2'-O)-methyltransferase